MNIVRNHEWSIIVHSDRQMVWCVQWFWIVLMPQPEWSFDATRQNMKQVVAYSEKTLCLQGKGQKGHKQTRVLQASLGANVSKTHQRKYTSCYHFLRMMWGVSEDVKLDLWNLASSWGRGGWGNLKIRVKFFYCNLLQD